MYIFFEAPCANILNLFFKHIVERDERKAIEANKIVHINSMGEETV